MTRTIPRLVLSLAAAIIVPAWPAATPSALAQDAKTIQLPAAQKSGGKPLMQALAERQSGREFGTQKLAPQVLSNLLWAAWGINRPDGRRTAPSARNWQDIDVYVTLPEGVYVYDAKAHTLALVVPQDLRGATGSQPFPAEAALNLVYVSDGAKIPAATPEADRAMYAGAHTGFIAQNVYLFCASEGLVTVVRALVDRPALAKRMQLRPEQRITLVQTVGYKK
jgi:nitroreductase